MKQAMQRTDMQPAMDRTLDESELAGITGGAIVCDGNACYLVADDSSSPISSKQAASKRHGMSEPVPVPASVPWAELKPVKRK